MKKTLRILAVLVVLAAGTTWLITGATIGWTKTSVAVKTLDPVTEIEGITYRKNSLPAWIFSAALEPSQPCWLEHPFSFATKKQPQTNN